MHGGKPLELEALAFSARGVAYGRCVAIGGPDLWIENTVVISDPAFALPILGVELLVFRGRMHLIVADMFPLLGRDEGVMDDIGPRFEDIGETPAMPAWAKKIFSRAPVFRKPRSEASLGAGAQAMATVGEAWLARARAASPVSDPSLREQARERLIDYARVHADDDPSGPFLERAFGQRGERLLGEVLFPVATLTRELLS